MNTLHTVGLAGTAPRWLPWLIAAAGFAFDCTAWWPGQMSFDSAYAWWQVRGGATTDIGSPTMVLVWRACNAIHSGPGLLFALHLALFWCGLALLVHALRFTSLAAAVTLLLVALVPVSLLLRGHVWTDVGMFSALTCATGALACAYTRQHRGWLLLVLATAFYATALRHNALPAIVPVAACCAWLALRDPRNPAQPKRWQVATATLAFLAATVATVHLIDRRVDRHVPVWPSLAQFDLAAISVASGHLWLPGFMIGPGLDVADLAQAFRGWSNTPMLQNTRHGMRDPFAAGYSAGQLRILRDTWLRAIAAEPRAWLAHRWRLTRGLFGTHPADWPHELVYVDAEVRYRDNPPVAGNRTGLHRTLMRAAATLCSTPALAAWPYLLLGLLAVPAAWSRRRSPAGCAAILLLFSAWLYALPLTLLAPAAELRYLGWPCIASLLAGSLAWLAPQTRTPRAAER